MFWPNHFLLFGLLISLQCGHFVLKLFLCCFDFVFILIIFSSSLFDVLK